jgi:hypothetical protein
MLGLTSIREANMTRKLLCILIIAAICAGCSTMYYNTMEKFGVHKRDIMVDRVKDAQKSQQEAKKEFKSALEQFSALVNVKGGDLQKVYDKLNARYESCDNRAKDIHDRIAAVEDVSGALFKEWKSELGQYSNAELRRTSEQELKQSQAQYKALIAAMKKAESKIPPVLTVMHDQVLFLKHNLNARAIASLQDELASVEIKVGDLLKEMEEAINEADAFIKTMNRP